MAMDIVKIHANSIIEALRPERNIPYLREMEDSVRDLDIADRGEAALNHLIGVCHGRALGDVLVRSMGWREWLNLLEKLRRACKRELKRQGKEAWENKRQRERGQEMERRKKAARADEP